MSAVLCASDLTVGYGRIEVVHGISFAANAGEVTCLLGPNGAGKTTTLRGVLGLRRPRRGTVTLCGEPVTGMAPHQIARRGVGLVPEGRRVFPSLSVIDNLRMGAAGRRARWRDPDGLDEVFTLFPVLQRYRHRPAGLLSGGEQQMLAIGRALMARPRLLILDEPSMGLAPKVVAAIYAVLADLKRRGVSILLAEQNARMALSVGDRAYVLESGRIAEAGTAEEMRRSPRVQEIYLGA